ncbi:MAG: M48 family metallopeptidase [Clostridiales bacterium]|nr:M48 family metallopeptidase [Clostridiales bacterium]
MSQTISISYNGVDYTLPYIIIKSRRKTYSIAIDEDGNIIFRVPMRAANIDIKEIAEEKSHWIITHYLKIIERKKNRPPSNLSNLQRVALEQRYIEAAHEYIPKRVAYYNAMTGGSYNKIAIRNQKTRWGSCSSKGTLSFNWRLMLAPPAILDYVVVHELCHLTYMNHSAEFWNLVESVFPDYRAARKWLKEHGNELVL